MRACRDRLLVLPLRRPEILALLGHPAPQFVGPRAIHLVQLRRHSLGFVVAAAHHSRRGVVKLAQIGQRSALREFSRTASSNSPRTRLPSEYALRNEARLAFSPNARPSHM